MSVIPIYIGTEPKQRLATEVLKHSVLSRTKSEVRFTELIGLAPQMTQAMHTGFSFYRFAVPHCAGYEGRAIYLDADIICLCDIEELFSLPLVDHPVLARVRGDERPAVWHHTSVLLFQCDRLTHWQWDSLCQQANASRRFYKSMMMARRDCPYYTDFGPLPPEFNHLDQHDARTKLLHFTNVDTQPWHTAGHPLDHLWVRELRSAIDTGAVSSTLVEEEISLGHVRSELRHVTI